MSERLPLGGSPADRAGWGREAGGRAAPERFSGAPAARLLGPAGVRCVVRVCAASERGAPAGDPSAGPGPLRRGEGVRNQGPAASAAPRARPASSIVPRDPPGFRSRRHTRVSGAGGPPTPHGQLPGSTLLSFCLVGTGSGTEDGALAADHGSPVLEPFWGNPATAGGVRLASPAPRPPPPRR